MMKRTVSLLLTILIMLSLPSARVSAAPVELSASAAILMEAETGMVLFESNADSRMQIASTTKILTALVVLENCGVDEVVTIRPEYTGVEGSSMYLKAGESFTVRELLYGLLLSSGNDAAVALACYTAQSVQNFAYLMNNTAAKLGCTDSSFVNPHGLDADGHHATARDLAVITAAAMENKTFAEIVSTKSISVAGRTFTNHNKLLWNYEGALGVKTGYTKSSGRSLVSCAERDGIKLICVTFSDPNDWADHAALFDWGFASVSKLEIDAEGESYCEIPVISGMTDSAAVRPVESKKYSVLSDEEYRIETELPDFVYAGILRGDPAGQIRVYLGDELIDTIPLVFSDDIEVDETIPLTGWEKVKWAWYFANRHSMPKYSYLY